MMKILSAKKGFTLVEMLIVISIVGLLATISIGGYTSFRKSSVLDLAADSIVADIYDARDSAKFGKVMGGGEEEADSGDEDVSEDGSGEDSGKKDVFSSKCFGVRFTIANGNGSGDAVNFSGIEKFTTDFNTQKKWNSLKGRWIYEGCGETDEKFITYVNLGELLKVEQIYKGVSGGVSEEVESGEGSGVGVDSCEVLFSPPNGEVSRSDCADIVIGYGDSDNDLKRKITIDSNTGKVTITKIENEEIVE